MFAFHLQAHGAQSSGCISTYAHVLDASSPGTTHTSLCGRISIYVHTCVAVMHKSTCVAACCDYTLSTRGEGLAQVLLDAARHRRHGRPPASLLRLLPSSFSSRWTLPHASHQGRRLRIRSLDVERRPREAELRGTGTRPGDETSGTAKRRSSRADPRPACRRSTRMHVGTPRVTSEW